VDHKSETIATLVDAVKKYQAENNGMKCHKPKAGGEVRELPPRSATSAVMAATNEDVKRQELPLIYWVYGAIITFLWLSFRTLSGVLCVICRCARSRCSANPMMSCSHRPESRDAAGAGLRLRRRRRLRIYSYTVVAEGLRRGLSLEEAYYQKMRSTGKATRSPASAWRGRGLWLFSNLQFQRDRAPCCSSASSPTWLGAIIVLPGARALPVEGGAEAQGRRPHRRRRHGAAYREAHRG